MISAEQPKSVQDRQERRKSGTCREIERRAKQIGNQERGRRVYESGNGRYESASVLWISPQERPFSSIWKNLQCVSQTNHFAKVCKATTKEVHTVSNEIARYEKPFFIGTIGSKEVDDKAWYVNFQINNCTITFNIDTGAQCNVMPRRTCNEAGIVTSGRSRSKLVSYSGHEIKTIGKADVVVLYQDRYHVIEVQVVEGDVMPVDG